MSHLYLAAFDHTTEVVIVAYLALHKSRQGNFMRPQSLKEAIERILLGGEEERIAIAEFLDEFYLHYGRTEQLQAMIDAPPPVAGRQPLDAYVGAIGEHLARRWGLAIPFWVEDECRFLDTPIFADDLQLMTPILLRDSPIGFRRRLIFTEAEPLRRGRFPVESAGFTIEAEKR